MDLAEITDKAIDYMLPQLQDLAEIDSPRLTEWEREQFLPSVIEQWHRKRWLSPKQKEIIGKIWDKI